VAEGPAIHGLAYSGGSGSGAGGGRKRIKEKAEKVEKVMIKFTGGEGIVVVPQGGLKNSDMMTSSISTSRSECSPTSLPTTDLAPKAKAPLFVITLTPVVIRGGGGGEGMRGM